MKKERKAKQRFGMPDGIHMTTNVKEFIQSWNDIAKPICEATGAKVHGFDPSIQIVWHDRIIDFPVSFLVKLNETLSKIPKE